MSNDELKLTTSDRIVIAMRNLNIKCSILTVVAKITDGGDQKSYDELTRNTIKEIEEKIKKAFGEQKGA